VLTPQPLEDNLDDQPITQSTGEPAVKPIEAGDKVVINGEPAEVIKVENLTEAAAKVPTEPIVIDASQLQQEPKQSPMEQAWNNLVTTIIRKSKGLGPDATVEIPAGETGHYVKYALDNQGRLSAGKGRGRRHVRWTSLKAMTARTMQEFYNRLFTAGLTGAFKQAKADAEKESTPENKVEPKQITSEKMQEIQLWASKKAEQLTEERMNGKSKAKDKAARKRQRLSRRVNFGLVPGNAAREIHSGS